MRISDWSSDVCSSDLACCDLARRLPPSLPYRTESCRCPYGVCGRLQQEYRGSDIPEGWLSPWQVAARCCSVRAISPSSRALRSSSLMWRRDRKSTRLTPVTNAHLVCRLLLEKQKTRCYR